MIHERFCNTYRLLGGGFGASGSAANAGASSQTFNAGGFPGFGGGLSGSSANAAASSQSFNAGGGGFGGQPYGGRSRY